MTETERLANIARRWPRHRWDGDGLSRWAEWGWRNYLFILIFALLGGLSIVEKGLGDNGEKQPWPLFGWLAASPSGFAGLAVLILLNGWLVNRGLADQTPSERTLPRWLRCLRQATVAVPVLGLYAIPLWREVIQRHPAWAFRSSVTSGPALEKAQVKSLAPLRDRTDSLRRALSSSLPWLIGWLIACQVAPWIGLLSWATTTDSLSPGRRAALGALSMLFRLLASALTIQYGILRGRQIRAGRMRLAVLWFAPLLFLLPFPSFIVGFLPWMTALGEQEETLVARVWGRKSQSSPQAVRARWSAQPSALATDRESSDVMDARFSFYRLKTLLLFLDAGALAWVLTGVGHPTFPGGAFPFRQIAPYLILAAGGLIAEGIVIFNQLSAWRRREEMYYLPYGRSVTFTQLALVGGLLFGALAARGDSSTAGQLLSVIGLGAVILSALIFTPVNFLLTRPGRRQIFITLAWVVLFFELLLVGREMYGETRFVPWFVTFFNTALKLSPLWGLALFFGSSGWLLHPFRLRHLFDRRLPGSARGILAAVALTAALPLGGLAIPFWLYAHNRLWPRFEPLMVNLNGRDAA